MDEDIKKNLKELADHIRAVGNQVSSTKADIQSLMSMSSCLKEASQTLDIYIGLQIDRYKEQLKGTKPELIIVEEDDTLNENMIDEYFFILNKSPITKVEKERRDYIHLTAMVLRACGGGFEEERVQKKFLRMIFKDELVDKIWEEEK